MAEPVVIVRLAIKAAGFIKDNWKILLVVFLAVLIFPYFVYITVANILLPQIDEDMLNSYRQASEINGISLPVLLSYDTIRYYNDMKRADPFQSVFDFMVIDYQVYEVEEVVKRRDEVEVEENIVDEYTVLVDGEEIEMAVEKVFKLLESANISGYDEITHMLEGKYFSYQTKREEMTILKVTDYLKELDGQDEYSIYCYILSAEEITAGFSKDQITWFNGLSRMLAIMYPGISDDSDQVSIVEIPKGKEADYIPSIWPVVGVISSYFGEVRAGGYVHKGLDIAAPLGTKVKTSATGYIIYAGWQGGYGNTVMIYHGYGITTVYGHLEKILVKSCDFLNKGNFIGMVGSTGRSTGPHLHYEIRINGVRVDPMNYLP